MKLHLPLSLLSAVLLVAAGQTSRAQAVEVPSNYTPHYLADPDDLYDYRTNSALLLVLWDEAARNEKQERKNISKRQKNIEHGGENSYHAQCYVFEVLENYQKAVRQSSPDLESSLR